MARRRNVKELSADDIHAIRMARGTVPMRVLGLIYDRSQAGIYHIMAGWSHRHVPFTDAELALQRRPLNNRGFIDEQRKGPAQLRREALEARLAQLGDDK